MTVVSRYVTALETAKAMLPAPFAGELLGAVVNTDGEMELRMSQSAKMGAEPITFTPADALRLAAWIEQNFGEKSDVVSLDA